jgi:hypothetical protein
MHDARMHHCPGNHTLTPPVLYVFTSPLPFNVDPFEDQPAIICTRLLTSHFNFLLDNHIP